MLIFRLEDREGWGVYSGGIALDICHALGDDYYAYNLKGPHPMPQQDSLLVRNGFKGEADGMRYGFRSYAQYRAWFFNDEFLQLAEEEGVRLVVYDVPDDDVIVGSTQCVFNNSVAVKVADFSPLDYLTDVEVEGILIP